MDQRERSNDFFEALRTALDGRQTSIWTAGPGIVQSFDPDKMTCVVQPAIKGRVTDKTLNTTFVNLPLLLDCPVVFMGGGGVTFTTPIQKDDECLVVFGSRCIDAWWQNGGVQPPLEARMHDLSDGFCLVGLRSLPRALSGISTTAAQIRSDDGETYVELDPTGSVTLKAPAGVSANAPSVDTTGNVNVGTGKSGTVTADGQIMTFLNGILTDLTPS